MADRGYIYGKTLHELMARTLASFDKHFDTDEVICGPKAPDGLPAWQHYIDRAFGLINILNNSGFQIGPEHVPDAWKKCGGLMPGIDKELVDTMQ